MLSRRIAITLVIIVLLANASASCLFSGRGPISDALPGGQARWNPVLAFIADQLTLPIPTAAISDVRDGIVPFFAAAALLACAWWLCQRTPATTVPKSIQDGDGSSRWERRFIPMCAAGILSLSVLSAITNHSWDYSWGWIVRTAAGLALVRLIQTLFTRDMIRWTLFGLLGLAAICLTLSLVHRISRGMAYPTWPIGPITITAALAAAWSAMALIPAIYQIQQPRGTLRALALFACSTLGLIVLIETGRRSPLAAWRAALFLASCLYLGRRLSRRHMLLAMGGAILVTVISGILLLSKQITSQKREVSGPIALRFEYWKHSTELIRDRWLLGYGPDTFVVHMTNKVAPDRAESPLFFHSNFDPQCHNEWLQAFVELGLPGGLVYLALPTGILLILSRRIVFSKDPRDLSMMLACLVGLLTIVITETASITLRGPIMPIFYWTLLGLSSALCTADTDKPARRPTTPVFKAAFLTLAAIAFLIATITDIRGSVHETFMAVTKSPPGPRLFGERHLSATVDYAAVVLEDAIADPQPVKVDRAEKFWQQLYDRVPGYGPVHYSLAKCLLLAKKPDDSRKVLKAAINNRTNPYDPKLNELFAELSPDDPMEQYHCAQRAARGGVPSPALQEIFLKALTVPAVEAQFDADVQRARAIAQSPDESTLRDTTVDTLRLSALAADKSHHTAEGVSDQQLVAQAYTEMEKKISRYRRAPDAESDAYLQLSLYLFDPLMRYQEAYKTIKEAERYAVLGIPHETLADAQPQYGYVIGEVMPTDFPEGLRPLWRFSALLHLIAGDDVFLEYRIFFSLPPQRWTQKDLKSEMAALAKQAYDAWTRLPPDQRPKHYSRLLEMSRAQ
jgi:O-antigen ligase